MKLTRLSMTSEDNSEETLRMEQMGLPFYQFCSHMIIFLFIEESARNLPRTNSKGLLDPYPKTSLCQALKYAVQCISLHKQ